MTTLPQGAYGLLLTFDGYEASKESCADVGLLHSILTELPGRIGMRRIGEPRSVSVDEPGIAGLSGFTFIMESHISIHTYSERGFVTADIYSCKWFDAEVAARYIADAFAIPSYETSRIVRGARFDPLPDGPGAHERP
jgi:S-adenosylmethionine decarboxylase